MKVTIECETPFETRRALGGTDAWLVLWKLAEEMRSDVTDGGELMHDSMYWRARLTALCDDYRVDLDDKEVGP